MNFFDVEGIRVKFVLEDKLLQVIESLFMRSLSKRKKKKLFNLIISPEIQSGTDNMTCLVSEVSLGIVNIKITTIITGNVTLKLQFHIVHNFPDYG